MSFGLIFNLAFFVGVLVSIGVTFLHPRPKWDWKLCVALAAAMVFKAADRILDARWGLATFDLVIAGIWLINARHDLESQQYRDRQHDQKTP